MRECVKCGEIKPLEMFVKAKQYRRRTCKKCESRRVRTFYKDNPDVYGAWKERKRSYKRHGLTEEYWSMLYEKHNGLCHSCKIEQATVIDHDHSCCNGSWSCGKCVRGLLCHGCNSAAGHLKDSKERAILLSVYLDG